MKIALCLSGYFNSLKDLTSQGYDGYDYIDQRGNHKDDYTKHNNHNSIQAKNFY